MYPYFNRKFGFKSIVLLRHPFAIAASSLNFGTNYDWHKTNHQNWRYHETERSDGFFGQLNEKSYLITSAFTLLVFQAVAQFSYILKHINKENTTVVFYEDLVINQNHVFKQLESFFDKKLDLNAFKTALKKQSFSSKEGHTKSDGKSQLSKWKQKISDEDIKQGLKIFEAFDFSVYSDDLTPIRDLGA